MTQEYQIS